MLLTCATVLSIFGLACVAHATETGWEYSRHVDDFDDSVAHFASNEYTENGEIFSVNVICDEDKELDVWFVPGQHVRSSCALSNHCIYVDARVDKRPKHRFVAVWLDGIASTVAEQGKIYRFVSDLKYGSKLIFRAGDSDTATFSLAGSIEPIDKVLKACEAP